MVKSLFKEILIFLKERAISLSKGNYFWRKGSFEKFLYESFFYLAQFIRNLIHGVIHVAIYKTINYITIILVTKKVNLFLWMHSHFVESTRKKVYYFKILNYLIAKRSPAQRVDFLSQRKRVFIVRSEKKFW